MTYGLETYNELGHMQLFSEFGSLQLVGKGTAGASTAITSPRGGYLHTKQTFNIPGSGSQRLLFWSVPTNSGNDLWYSPQPYVSAAATSVDCYIYYPFNATPILPEVYVFRLDVLSSGSGYGIQVFNASGQLTYDSNFKAMVLRGISQVTVDPPTVNQTMTNTSTKPAYAFFRCTRYTNTINPIGPGETQNRWTRFRAAFQRLPSNNLSAKTIDTANGSFIIEETDFDFSGQGAVTSYVPHIDANAYEVA